MQSADTAKDVVLWWFIETIWSLVTQRITVNLLGNDLAIIYHILDRSQTPLGILGPFQSFLTSTGLKLKTTEYIWATIDQFNGAILWGSFYEDIQSAVILNDLGMSGILKRFTFPQFFGKLIFVNQIRICSFSMFLADISGPHFALLHLQRPRKWQT